MQDLLQLSLSTLVKVVVFSHAKSTLHKAEDQDYVPNTQYPALQDPYSLRVNVMCYIVANKS